MAFCPECRAEYRKGFDHCPTCDVDLVDEVELPELMTDEEVIASMSEEDLVGIVRGSIEGCRETQAKLLEHRIPAAINESEDVVAEAGHFRILQVVVRKEDAERAQEALNQDWGGDAQREGLLTGCFHRDRQRLGITRSPSVQRYRHDRAAVHVDSMLALVREVSPAVLHLRDLGIRIIRMRPIVV